MNRLKISRPDGSNPQYYDLNHAAMVDANRYLSVLIEANTFNKLSKADREFYARKIGEYIASIMHILLHNNFKGQAQKVKELLEIIENWRKFSESNGITKDIL